MDDAARGEGKCSGARAQCAITTDPAIGTLGKLPRNIAKILCEILKAARS